MISLRVSKSQSLHIQTGVDSRTNILLFFQNQLLQSKLYIINCDRNRYESLIAWMKIYNILESKRTAIYKWIQIPEEVNFKNPATAPLIQSLAENILKICGLKHVIKLSIIKKVYDILDFSSSIIFTYGHSYRTMNAPIEFPGLICSFLI